MDDTRALTASDVANADDVCSVLVLTRYPEKAAATLKIETETARQQEEEANNKAEEEMLKAETEAKKKAGKERVKAEVLEIEQRRVAAVAAASRALRRRCFKAAATACMLMLLLLLRCAGRLPLRLLVRFRGLTFMRIKRRIA
jgi:hypothetical protein